jgi:hypothetical protein
MANIVYRSGVNPSLNPAGTGTDPTVTPKGTPLSNNEIDGNFYGLQSELLTKAPTDSPTLTGTPAAPTAAAGTNTTQIATTAFVISERTTSATLTNKTLTNPTINAGAGVVVLPAAAAPAQTAEGSVVWDSDDDLLTVGTGTARKTMVDTDSSQALTNKTVNRITITTPANGSTLTIADGKTFTLSNTLSFSGTDASSVAFGTGGTVAYQGGSLAQFASTTSAQLAGVISDETGTGALVFASSPTLVTPIVNTSMRVPIVYGSNTASANLTLSSTSSGTKGAIILGESGDTTRLNTTTNGVLTTANSNGTFAVDTTVYYKAGGTDVAIADGGTGLSTAPTAGQVLIGTSSNTYALGSIASGTGISVTNASGSVTIANSGVTSITGTANRITASAGTGGITLSGPQDIHTAATPSFTQVNLGSAPTAVGHAATKAYVDSVSSSIGNGAFSVNVGGGLSGGGALGTANQSTATSVTISHADTSSVVDLSASSRTYVTGLTFDTYGHVTGVSTGSETVVANNGLLTLNVSGVGLSGSTTFSANQSTAATFTVTSNATSANTASAIVARDASGNFSAGTITASLSGNASTVTNGVYTSGNYADPAWITSLSAAKISGTVGSASSATNSTNSTFVNVTATGADATYFLAFAGSQTTGQQSIYVDNSSGSYNPSSNTATINITGSAGYANSAGSAGAVAASNITGQVGMWTSAARPGPNRLYRRDGDSDYSVQTYWTGSLWRLYGYNGDTAHADTHVGYADSAGTASSATSAGNSTTVAGLAVHTGRNNEVNKVVRTDGSGYLQVGYINSSSGNEGNNSNPARVWGTNGTDDYLRTYLTSALSVNYANSAGGVAWTNVSGRPTAVSAFTNDSGYITGITSANVTTALGYTPYNSSNPNGYITSSGSISGNAATATTATTANALNTANNYQMNSLGVGTGPSGTAGEIRATNNVTAYYSSDKKFKENINEVANATEIVSAIGTKTFQWTDDYIQDHGGEDGYFVTKDDFGVIAQDVQAVFPMAVRTREDGSLAVDYGKLAVLAFGAIKELSERIAKLENK